MHTLISRVVRFAEGQSPRYTVARAAVLAALSSALLEAPAAPRPVWTRSSPMHARWPTASWRRKKGRSSIESPTSIRSVAISGRRWPRINTCERCTSMPMATRMRKDRAPDEMALALLRSGSPRRAETLMFEALELYRLAATPGSGQQVESEGASDGLPAAGAPGGLVNLALSLVAQHRYALGRELLEKADRQNQEELGEDHPKTLRTLDNIAASYFKEGYAAKARPLGEKALSGLRRAAGDDDPDTITAMGNLACTMIALDEIGEGLSLAAEAYERAERISVRTSGNARCGRYFVRRA